MKYILYDVAFTIWQTHLQAVVVQVAPFKSFIRQTYTHAPSSCMALPTLQQLPRDEANYTLATFKLVDITIAAMWQRIVTIME